MRFAQADLFAPEDDGATALSQPQRAAIRARLEATLARLEATQTFPWRDALDAVHEENRFERDSKALGEEGAALWARFDNEMDRLYANQPGAES